MTTQFPVEIAKGLVHNPEETICSVLDSPWYTMLSDTDQAEFWMVVSAYAVQTYGLEELDYIGAALDGWLPDEVHSMVLADWRELYHHGMGGKQER